MKLVPLREDLIQYLETHNLKKKWIKVSAIFENNHQHPSLNSELLEPHWHGIYSFRIDKKYRALFFIKPDNTAEVFAITNHYKK
jgi:Txe/YoeB family toxin of Txe-Axe toxin-antitoxin module